MKTRLFSDWSLAGDWQRKASLLAAVVSLVFWTIVFPPKSAAHFMADTLLRITFLALPLACIWFSEELAAYYRDGSFFPEITTPSLGKFVLIGGWVWLLLPFWSYLLIRLLMYLYVQ